MCCGCFRWVLRKAERDDDTPADRERAELILPACVVLLPIIVFFFLSTIMGAMVGDLGATIWILLFANGLASCTFAELLVGALCGEGVPMRRCVRTMLQMVVVIFAWDLNAFIRTEGATARTPVWPLQVLVLDFLLVIDADPRLSIGVCASVVVWLVGRVGFEVVWLYLNREEQRNFIGLFYYFSANLAWTVPVLVVDFYFTRGFAVKVRGSVALAQDVAAALVRYDLSAAEEVLRSSAAGRLPTDLRRAYIALLINLRQYQPYLPDAVMCAAIRRADGLETDDAMSMSGGGLSPYAAGWLAPGNDSGNLNNAAAPPPSQQQPEQQHQQPAPDKDQGVVVDSVVDSAVDMPLDVPTSPQPLVPRRRSGSGQDSPTAIMAGAMTTGTAGDRGDSPNAGHRSAISLSQIRRARTGRTSPGTPCVSGEGASPPPASAPQTAARGAADVGGSAGGSNDGGGVRNAAGQRVVLRGRRAAPAAAGAVPGVMPEHSSSEKPAPGAEPAPGPPGGGRGGGGGTPSPKAGKLTPPPPVPPWERTPAKGGGAFGGLQLPDDAVRGPAPQAKPAPQRRIVTVNRAADGSGKRVNIVTSKGRAPGAVTDEWAAAAVPPAPLLPRLRQRAASLQCARLRGLREHCGALPGAAAEALSGLLLGAVLRGARACGGVLASFEDGAAVVAFGVFQQHAGGARAGGSACSGSCRAALRVRADAASLDAETARHLAEHAPAGAEGWPPAVGGVLQGVVWDRIMIGEAGTDDRRGLHVVGPALKLVRDLCELNDRLGTQVLCTHPVWVRVQAESWVSSRPQDKVDGFGGPVYELLSEGTDAPPAAGGDGKAAATTRQPERAVFNDSSVALVEPA